MEQQSQLKIVLRWVAFLPAAIGAAWLAWLVVSIGNRITMSMQGIDSESFLSKVFIEFISHAAMGAGFVFVGAKIAPSHNQIVGYSLAGIGLVAAGFLLFPAFLVSNYWAIWGGFSLILGVGVTAYSIGTGEVRFEP